tara:strand:+ start:1401 stop:2621 length:1221 start_codon:yes stop_codon:yes gene_type:complete
LISIRKFPYPYQAALAISSDIDNASSLESFVEIMILLNGNKINKLGHGLGLEVGNSFWFFNNSGKKQLSYFNRLTSKESEFAPYCRELWSSGHLDVLHSYGNFDCGEFQRKYAEIAVNELKKNNVAIPVWVNHGIFPNTQSVGNYDHMLGAIPGTKEYHMDLADNIGLEYFWMGKNTHVIGQDGKPTLSVKGKEWIQLLMKKTRFRNEKRPLYDDLNSLLLPIKFQDSRTAWEFQRWINAWGKETVLDVNDFAQQISKGVIQTLIHNSGFMIIYTHFNENVSITNGLPSGLLENLKYIQQQQIEGKLFVTTTSRLLKFKEVSSYLKCSTVKDEKRNQIIIPETIETPVGQKRIAKKDLQGITFYCEEPQKTKVFFKDHELMVATNSLDEIGKFSVSIPWEPLEFPW